MRKTLVVLGSAISLMSLPAWSGPPPGPSALGYVDPGHAHENGRGASQEQIIESVQKRYNAKVVRVTETDVDGRPALRLRLLSAQRVWTVVVDASSGQVLSGG